MYIFIYNLYFVYFVYVRIIYLYVILNTNSIQSFKKKLYEKKKIFPGGGLRLLIWALSLGAHTSQAVAKYVWVQH